MKLFCPLLKYHEDDDDDEMKYKKNKNAELQVIQLFFFLYDSNVHEITIMRKFCNRYQIPNYGSAEKLIP